MGHDRGGFSLVEMILIVLFIGIFAAVALPRLNLAVIGEQASAGVAQKIAADLRYTRQLALTRAADSPDGFGLFMMGRAPYEEYEIRDLSDSRVLHTGTIDESTNCEGGRNFRFGPLGNLLAGSDTQLTVAAGDRTYTMTLVPATGAVQCVKE